MQGSKRIITFSLILAYIVHGSSTAMEITSPLSSEANISRDPGILRSDMPREILTNLILPIIDVRTFCRFRQTCRTLDVTLGELGIQHLNLADVPHITTDAFIKVLLANPKLRALSVPSSFNIMGLGFQPSFQTAFKGLRQIERLEFDGGIAFTPIITTIYHGDTLHKMHEFINFFERFPKLSSLRSICVRNGKAQTTGDIIFFWLASCMEVSEVLESLYIINSGITDTTILYLLGELPRLSHLCLKDNEIGDKGASLLIDYACLMPRLKYLDLRGNSGIGDESKDGLRRKFGDLARL